ncbi:MAG: hypothetical protein AAF502_09860 [Bacteroidota bacterium]
MGLFERLFGGGSKKDDQPNIPFGRYSDSYKSNTQYDAWDAAVSKFEEKNYLDSYKEFFNYLSDPSQNNVKWWEEDDGKIYFELLQGSKKVSGSCTNEKVQASTKVVKCDRLNVGFMRRLMEKNYNLKYGRFALDDSNDIVMKFDTYVVDGSPWKLYYALKEVANNADKQDDLLIDEFDMLHAVDTGHVREIPGLEKNVKFDFVQKWIKETVARANELDGNRFSGGIAYLLLNLFYKLDYLIQPEGFMMETLERGHRTYFARDEKTTQQKNDALIKELNKLVERPRDEFNKEMYRVTSTFGITNPVNHDRVVSFIDGELNNMDWYKENNYPKIATSIPGYIAGYCLFNYAIPQPDRELLHLLIEILESDYFEALGFTHQYYDLETKKFDKSGIRREISSIVKSNLRKYPKFDPKVNTLSFDSLADFAKTFMLMVRNLDLSPAKNN